MGMEIISSSGTQFLLNKDLHYEEEPIVILDHDLQKLRTKEIKLVKVQ